MAQITPLAFVALTLMLLAPPAHAQSDQADRIREARTVFDEIMKAPDRAVPSSVLERAEAIAIFPSTIKGGFIVAGHRGRGVLSVRDRQSGAWSPPAS